MERRIGLIFASAISLVIGGLGAASAADLPVKAPPLPVAVISRHVPSDIPEWEQRLSAGAVCALLIIAAQAMGYGANWITDWYAYDADARAVLGLDADELVAGFVHLGTAGEAPLERARPALDDLVGEWRG